jgi:hypothetical protein
MKGHACIVGRDLENPDKRGNEYIVDYEKRMLVGESV